MKFKVTPGYVAFFVGLISLVPQLYKIFITHDIGSYSLVFIILTLVGQCLWMAQGVFISNDKAQIINSIVWISFYVYVLYLYISQKLLSLPEDHHAQQKMDGNKVGHI